MTRLAACGAFTPRDGPSSLAAQAPHRAGRTGDGLLATFDAPSRGLHCATMLRHALAEQDISIRAGVHTGEIEIRGEDVAGIAVHIAARVAALAASDELLASRTVKDLAAGSGYTFTSRGTHSLKGVPEQWELLAVT